MSRFFPAALYRAGVGLRTGVALADGVPLGFRLARGRAAAGRPRHASGSSSSAGAGAAARPFRILGLQQIAIGGRDKAALRKFWVDVLGVPFVRSADMIKENVSEDICALGRGPFTVEVDLMQSIDTTKPPKVAETPLNHIGLWVDDLRAAVASLTASGVRFTPGAIRPGAAGHDITFIHPKGNEQFPLCGLGVLVELVQAPPEVIAAFDKLK
jgi:lactoylglutathione lyase